MRCVGAYLQLPPAWFLRVLYLGSHGQPVQWFKVLLVTTEIQKEGGMNKQKDEATNRPAAEGWYRLYGNNIHLLIFIFGILRIFVQHIVFIFLSRREI